jgi:hypothetical protein
VERDSKERMPASAVDKRRLAVLGGDAVHVIPRDSCDIDFDVKKVVDGKFC